MDLPRRELVAVILAVVSRVELLEEGQDVVKVRELAGEADDRRAVHLLDALNALVPLGGTVRACGTGKVSGVRFRSPGCCLLVLFLGLHAERTWGALGGWTRGTSIETYREYRTRA
jgi:hypothetical protein